MLALAVMVYGLLLLLLPSGWTVVLFNTSRNIVCVAASGQSQSTCRVGETAPQLGLTPEQVVATWELP